MKTLSFNYASLKTAAFALGLATVMGFASFGIATASGTHDSSIKHGKNPSDASQTTTETNPSAFGSKVEHGSSIKHGENPSDASRTTTETNPSAFGSGS